MSAASASTPDRRARTTLTIRIVGGALALVVAGFCAAAGAMLYDMRQDTWNRAVTAENNLLQTLSQDIARNIELYDLSLQAVAERVADPDILRLSPRLQDFVLYDRSASAQDLGAILVLDRNGRVLRGSIPEAIGADLGDRDYFQVQRADANRGLYISVPFTRRVTGKDQVIALSRRLNSADGTFAGIVVGTMRLSYFAGLFANADIGDHGSINLMRRDGICLMRVPFDASMIGRDFAASGNFKRYLGTGETSFVGAAATDAVRRIYHFGQVGDLPLVLTVALSEDDVFALWRGKASMIALALATLCATAGLLWLVLIRQMRRTAEARRLAVRSEAQYRLLADHAQDIIMRLDRRLLRTYVSPAVRSVLGHVPEDLIGLSPRGLVHPDDWQAVEALIAAAQADGCNAEATYRLRHAAGHYVWMEGRYSILAEDGGFIVVLRDITMRKAAEERLAALNAELAHLASNDALTGLANRRHFDEALEAEWSRARRDGRPVSLLLVDVDRFKAYNDLYGHQDGDACLRAIADAVSSVARRAGTLVARYGGEELAVVLPGADEAGAAALAERIRAAIEGLGRVHAGNPGCGGLVTASLGCATLQPGDLPEASAAALIADADVRLYEAKRIGRNRVVDRLSAASGVPVPSDEEQRLAVLAAYEACGAAEPASALDTIATIAARLFQAPIGFVSLVGKHQVAIAGRHGTDLTSAPRDDTYCAHTIHGEEPMVVLDTRADPRFADNPFTQAGIAFYAGAPLISPFDDRVLGALCIADTGARARFDDRHRALLADLAGIAMADIERRRLEADREPAAPVAA